MMPRTRHALVASGWLLLFSLLIILIPRRSSGQQESLPDHVATARQGMVATVHPLATDAAVAALKSGGNAVDAAIAAALTLGVVDNYNSGIGGGCFILIRRANGEILAIDGREMAPAQANREMFIRDGKPDTRLSQVGALASGVPGALLAYEKAIELAGRQSLSELIRPAARLASDGFPVSSVYAAALRSQADKLRRFPASRQALLKPDGTVYEEGEVLQQPHLAQTYLAIAEQGTDWFYRGPFARATEEWMLANEGIMTAEDFAKYQVLLRQPVITSFRGYQIVGFPPPSSGGVHVAQILNILENFQPLREYDDVTRIHLLSEAMKLAFADRAYWLGDADFTQVPKGLIDKGYATSLAKRIRLDQATVVKSHGKPPLDDGPFGEQHTTHIVTADAAGNWVALTQTINTTFGSKVVIPGTGVVMNNEMDDFSVAPGIANAFGLVGAEANSVAPGKRPLSSMSPTIILREGQPVMTVGAAGGPKIISQSLLATLRYLELGYSLGDAIGQPRFHHQWSPDRILLEDRVPLAIEQRLQKMGHQTVRSRIVGVSQAIARDKDGTFIGVHDPRVPGKAGGF